MISTTILCIVSGVPLAYVAYWVCFAATGRLCDKRGSKAKTPNSAYDHAKVHARLADLLAETDAQSVVNVTVEVNPESKNRESVRQLLVAAKLTIDSVFDYAATNRLVFSAHGLPRAILAAADCEGVVMIWRTNYASHARSS